MAGALSFLPILKIGPVPTRGPPKSKPFRHRASSVIPCLAPARSAHCSIPTAATRCCHASVVESVCDGLQGCGACLTHRLYDRQYCVCEALGFSLASLTTAATNGIEVRVAQFYTAYLGRCQRRLGTLRDQRALLLCQGRVDVQHERICVPTQRRDDERHLVRHKAGDEADVAGQPI